MKFRCVVVSVFYNRSRYVANTVESILRILPDECHLLLVDDGSTDNTLEEMRRFSDSRISIRTGNNVGFVRSIKDAIASTDSDYIAIHGSGDIALNNRFIKQIDFLDNHPDVVAVGCYIDISDDSRRPNIHRGPTSFDRNFILKYGNPFKQGEVMMRRSAYNAVDGYCEFFWFAQDKDLWIRLGSHGSFAIIPEVLYQRTYIVDSVAVSPQKRLQQLLFSTLAESRFYFPEFSWSHPSSFPALLRYNKHEFSRKLLRIYLQSIDMRKPIGKLGLALARVYATKITFASIIILEYLPTSLTRFLVRILRKI